VEYHCALGRAGGLSRRLRSRVYVQTRAGGETRRPVRRSRTVTASAKCNCTSAALPADAREACTCTNAQRWAA
jgi:hypothetical protein